MVHGLPQRATAPSPRCAATAYASSPATSSAPGWPRPETSPSPPAAASRRSHTRQGRRRRSPSAWARAALPEGEVTVTRRRAQLARAATSTWATRTRSPSSTTSRTPAICSPLPPFSPAAAYPDGVNVEFVVDRGPRHVAMRVHERGSGETRSCGTGACAVAVAAARTRRRWTRRSTGTPGHVHRRCARRALVITERPDGEIEMTGSRRDRRRGSRRSRFAARVSRRQARAPQLCPVPVNPSTAPAYEHKLSLRGDQTFARMGDPFHAGREAVISQWWAR